MGWSMVLTVDRDLRKEDVDTTLTNAIFLLTGWRSMGVMIHLPEGNELRLTGALHDADCAKHAARFLKTGLTRLGYKVTIGEVM